MDDSITLTPWKTVLRKSVPRLVSVVLGGAGVLAPSCPALAAAQQVATEITTATPTSMRRVTLDATDMPILTALQAIAREAGLSPAYNKLLIPLQTRVTLHFREAAPAEAFAHVLRGTGLAAEIKAIGVVSIVRAAETPVTTGVIRGRVRDGATMRGLRGATIVIDNASRGVFSDADGDFQVTGVTAGPHHLTARLIGYRPKIATVVVADGATITTDFLLETGMTTLDQVVVTGTVIPTELKAVPNAMTVITAKQLEERGITRIDQLFRGDVPGLFVQNRGADANAVFSEVTMYSRGATSLNENAPLTGTFTGFSNPIKTYIDGVELADPQYLSQIDPKNIERIEILTGPQASTIYGSNALNGVMQIFTKRGSTSQPQLMFNALGGWVENNFKNTLTPQHDYSGQLSGVEGHMSYSVTGSWSRVGRWTPAQDLTRINIGGGLRMAFMPVTGPVTIDIALRQDGTLNDRRGNFSQVITNYRTTALYAVTSPKGVDRPVISTLEGHTIGMTLNYIPRPWWSHEFGMGQDESQTETRYQGRGYGSVLDTNLQYSQGVTRRKSLRYRNTIQFPLWRLLQGIVTTGIDEWQTLATSLSVSTQSLTGQLVGTPAITRNPEHNAGAFLQTQLGVNDQLYFTYGLRAEWNPKFGAEAQPNYAPRYGIAYTRDLGLVTTKVRASYGRSTRPPGTDLKTAHRISEYWGSLYNPAEYINADYLLGNSELGPEYQQGGEGGIELYLGSRASLVVTRYNQTVDGLIASVIVDSIRSLIPNPSFSFTPLDNNGYGYWIQQQYLNLASIRNQGWELQGMLQLGPWSGRGTYSWTKSRTIGVNPKYRAFFTVQDYPQYQPGASFQYLPEHTWALGVNYVQRQTTLSLNITGIGTLVSRENALYQRGLSPFLRFQRDQFRTSSSGYVSRNPGYAMADATASQRLVSWAEGIIQIQNLTNKYRSDYFGSNATIGRQSKFGVRIRL